MLRIPPRLIQSYIFGGSIRSHQCLRAGRTVTASLLRPLHTTSARHSAGVEPPSPNDAADEPYVPLRKQIKDELKRRKAAERDPSYSAPNTSAERLSDWELTVGIEIHAQLNTLTKLFSIAPTAPSPTPNKNVTPFDLAIPGSQPIFQPTTLIPAVRAALALNCTIHNTSTFDRKHYFHWDQPAGYQLTQFYRPFATDGHITLYEHDGISPEDYPQVTIGIKQVQMEQDTAKTLTTTGPDGTESHLIDYSRVGTPLIEIITHPHLQHPRTAAALVRKIQTLLHSVNACVIGMESGGLRADVNVSVRPRDTPSAELGQRTEIKNLSSYKSIRDAIIAERTRQIDVLESGGVVLGETRGFSVGDSETRRLRAKEGEVDYRYMPDPDIPPIIIGTDLVTRLSETLGTLPDAELAILTGQYGISIKDALSLVALENGGRAEYLYAVVEELRPFVPPAATNGLVLLARKAGNWVLHELGAAGASAAEAGNDAPLFDDEGVCVVSPAQMARIIYHVECGAVTGATGKELLAGFVAAAGDGEGAPITSGDEVDAVIEREGMWFKGLDEEGYKALAAATREDRIVEDDGEGGGWGVDAKVAEGWVRRALEEEIGIDGKKGE
ncbi:hypothetical protein GMDG_08074 [Pseudogymnoascus destructans 20631-21]|uniref:Glutamyl-tRNA(Gln) amidotransferase subunit B, mitochondrial n=1 Tax=Pseudogymnoascus destructans (strain ATCC MYA-4855 / 20631-21) TaxID=658429 RepID=L8G3U9_PSED2|nr:hypothetical protein GMDG_08074 [Pseudogymnoascus destructans 20631-21]